jgi:hypothetical protein
MHTGQHVIYHAQNNTGETIAKGTPVMFAGTTGNSGKLRIKPWDGIGPATLFMGITGEEFVQGHEGTVVAFGKVRGIQTNGGNYSQTWADGTIIYAGTNSVKLTSVKPSAPNPIVEVMAVVSAHANTGTVFVRPNYFTADVFGPSSVVDNAIARFDGTTGKLIQTGGITIADGATGTLSGTNSGDVTLGGTPAYLTIANQVITRNQVSLTAASAHVTGTLPVANGGTGQTALSSVNANSFGSGNAADNYVLTSNGSGGAAWEAATGGSVTGTGFAYVRTGGSATPTTGNPALPFPSVQTLWSAGSSNYAIDVGPGAWTLDALHPTSTGSVYTFFFRGAGPDSTISITWRMEDNPIGHGFDTPTLRIFSDKSVKISLTIEGGDSTSVDTSSGGKVGNYEFYNCWIDTLTITPGEGTSGVGTGAIADAAYAEYTVIENGLMEATTITRNAVVEADIFYPIAAVSDGTKGQILVSSGGSYWTLLANTVGIDQIASAPARGSIIGRKTAGSGNYEVCAITDFTGVVGAVYAESTDFTTSTGALVNVTGLSCPIAMNEKLLIEVVGYKNTSSANDGMRFSFTGPAGASSVLFNLEAWTATTASRVTPVQSGFNTNALETTGNVSSFPFRATCTVINGGTGGTVQFQAGSEGSGVSLTISRGAVMRVTRIA